MRKLLAIAMLLLTAVTAGAQTEDQQGTWKTGTVEGDELKGIKSTTYYQYEVEGVGSFVTWDWTGWTFRINCHKGSFEGWLLRSDNFRYIRDVRVGLYSLDGKLQESVTLDLASDNTYQMAYVNSKGAYFPSVKKRLRKVLKALKEGTGYARILCTMRNAPDFDLKVMPYRPS